MTILYVIWDLIVMIFRWCSRRRRRDDELEPLGSNVIHLAPRGALREGRRLGRSLDG
jgi:hypothetical protein